MTRFHACEGEQQDDTGAWYCPHDPDRDDYNCVACRSERDQEVDRAVEAKWERDRWGE